MADGRFAPSPTGDLHLGNLRTALVAWLVARSTGGRFLVRMEDLDPVTVRSEAYARQLEDLATLGLTWDGTVMRQSERRAVYDEAIAGLEAAGLTYPCYCTRREILEAASAPHGPAGAYPGTCRGLSDAQRAEWAAGGRPPALRLRAGVSTRSFVDGVHGPYAGPVDDVVLRRNDGTPAYNLAVVVDDVAQGVDQVVRGDDLLPSTPRQLHVADRLGLAPPAYAHVPLVLAADGSRLAKRHGAVTLRDRHALGETTATVTGRLTASLGLTRAGVPVTPDELVQLSVGFNLARLPRSAWVFETTEATT